MRSSPSSLPLSSLGRGLIFLVSGALWAGACGFPDQSFVPDSEFYGQSGSSGAAGDAGAGGSGTSGVGGEGGAGESGSGSGGAGAGGAGAGGAGAGGAGAGQGGDAGSAGSAGDSGAAGSAGSAGDGGGAGSGGAGQAGASGQSGAGNGGSAGASGAGAGGAGASGAGNGGGGAANCHSACDKGEKLDPSCSPCVEAVCKGTPTCCSSDWTAFCVLSAKSLCGPTCSDPVAGAGGSSGKGGSSGASGQSGAGNGGSAGAGQGGAGQAGAGQGGAGAGQGGAGAGGAGAGQGGAGAGQGGAGAGSGGAGAGQGGAGAGSGGSGGSAGCGGVLGGLCDHTADCICGQVCSKFTQAGATVNCQNPKATGVDIGVTCVGNGSCLSNSCDAFTKTCSVGCKGSPDCGSGNVCGRTFFTQTEFYDQCFKGCTKDSDCPNNAGGSKVCFLKDDIEIDVPVWACAYLGRDVGETLPNGGIWRGFGETMEANDSCYSGLALANGFCSKACADSADCAAPLPTCGNVNVTNPSGNGITVVKGCVP